jgi:WD40 repeat protein
MPETPAYNKAKLAWMLPWDAHWVTAVTFLGPTRRIAAGNNLGQIMLWDLPEKAGDPIPSPCRRLDGHTNVITRLLSTPDGRYLISASYDHTIRIWDMQAPTKGSEEIVLNAHAISEAEARKSNGAKVPPPVAAKVELQQADKVLDVHKDWIVGLSLSADGNVMISGDDQGNVVVWDRPAAKEIRRWKVKGWVFGMALSPDAQLALIAERFPLVFTPSDHHSGVKIWDATTGQMKKDLTADYKMYVGSAAFSPDGKLLALAQGNEGNGKLFLLESDTGKKLREFPGHNPGGAHDVHFSADGKFLISCGRDTAIRVWNVADGKQVAEIGKPRGGQFKDIWHALSQSGDGLWLSAADMAGQVVVYTLGAEASS